jgi:hypothetical protein
MYPRIGTAALQQDMAALRRPSHVECRPYHHASIPASAAGAGRAPFTALAPQ